jgi:anti-sigma regulatory factor (Ser/Thr protein kinase)
MKFNADKKQTIILYLLEKISANTKSVSKVVSDAFDISTNTVHTYINELILDGVIKKGKRGQYELVSTQFDYTLKRSKGELDSDTYAYDACLSRHIASLAENVKRIWLYAFTEMANNVVDHSDAENMQVIVTQNYLETAVLIMDDGVGIFEKIKKHFSLSGLDEAICELFKGKLTTDEQNHSGEGIFFTSKMMDKFLISSSGKIFTTSKYNNDNVFDMDEASSGTCVFMSLSNFTHKEPREVFDLYSNDDGGFSKTRIPLKNIFDSAPVSRSQAKRVCNRLEDFQEVIFDFDDIGWMGQGFAHQLFVVFQNSHPQISLVPINMNESVTNMYNHVLNSSRSTS